MSCFISNKGSRPRVDSVRSLYEAYCLLLMRENLLLYIEAEMGYIAVFHDVILAF